MIVVNTGNKEVEGKFTASLIGRESERQRKSKKSRERKRKMERERGQRERERYREGKIERKMRN